MDQRGIGRSALLVGLLVLAVLVGGRIAGSMSDRQVGQFAIAERSGVSEARQVTASRSPRASASSSRSPSAAPTSPKPASTTSTAPKPQGGGHPGGHPGGSHPADPTFGAKRTTGSTAVALTFDDGPDPTWTPQLLDLLRSEGVKATFCLIGIHVRQYPQLVQRIVREGHSLCNHSWQHDLKLGQKTPAEIQSDLSRTSAEIRKAVPGARITFYRQPGGMWTQNIVQIAKQLGMTPLGWAVDPSDWDKPGTQAIIDRVTSHTHGGSIVLMHDAGGDRSESLAACRTLLPRLKQQFRLVALR